MFKQTNAIYLLIRTFEHKKKKELIKRGIRKSADIFLTSAWITELFKNDKTGDIKSIPPIIEANIITRRKNPPIAENSINPSISFLLENIVFVIANKDQAINKVFEIFIGDKLISKLPTK